MAFSVKAACCDYDFSFGDYYVPSGTQAKFLPHEGAYPICEGDVKAIPILLSNKISANNLYELRIQGADFAVLPGNRFEVGASQQGIITLYLNPSSGSKGEYIIALAAVEKRGGITKQGAIKVNVEKCFDFEASLDKEDEICSCESSAYNIKIKNKGKYAGNFSIEIEGPDWANISESSVGIDAGSEGSVLLSVNPQCDLSGKHTINILTKL